MLPTSKDYLSRAGFSSSVSAYILTGLFVAGVIVIQVVSGFIHRFIPSHVVDCAHHHGEPETDPERGENQTGGGEDHHYHHKINSNTEQTPLLQSTKSLSFKSTPAVVQRTEPASYPAKRESLRAILTRRISSLVGGVKPHCDENGPCYGFSQTCGRECTKVPAPKISPPLTLSADEATRPSLVPRHQSITMQPGSEGRARVDSHIESFRTAHEAGYFDTISAQHDSHYAAGSSPSSQSQSRRHETESTNTLDLNQDADQHLTHTHEDPESAPFNPTGDSTHHHHVPQNAFLSIGLQTSVAIALHKLPEGFITYATNHANPNLGLTVFLALFIHNIVEGFAMALPLYLALSSRWKAMFWSSLLGGISQPAGAGLAALWIWGSGHSGHDTRGPSWGVYGGMFAATAGVMTSVALQLFSEGLGLTHHRGMGIGFAVAGMGLMGLSFALTA